MGMDLIALDPQGDNEGGHHFNWSGWSVLCDLLVELGCDVDELSGSNDGEVVCDTTAKAWASTITEALAAGRIYSVSYPDRMMAGGLREEFHVEDTTTPVLLNARAVVQAMFAVEDGEDTDALSGTTDNDRAPAKAKVSLRNEQGEWLADIAKFFASAGGFEQC